MRKIKPCCVKVLNPPIMRRIGIILMTVILFGCGNKENKIESFAESENIEKNLENVSFTNNNHPFIDSSEFLKFSVIIGDTINITNYKMDYLYDTLTQMTEVDAFRYFQADSLIEKIREFNLNPYFYAISKKRMNYFPVMIVYRWGESAILSDYLLYDSQFKLKGIFTPSFIDQQPNYYVSWFGYFTNDSTFRQYRIDWEDDNENETIEYRDSSIYELTIHFNGKVASKLIESYKDTVIDTEMQN